MIPSIVLRKIISQIYTLKLNTYAWNKKLENMIFSIKVNDLGRKITLKDVYLNGCNIGNCLFTSCLIQTKLKNLSRVVGKVEILKGTKNSVLGDHVWLEDEYYIYYPTIMIKLPKEDQIAKLYNKEYNISSMIGNAELSYSDEFYLLEKEPNVYYSKLFKVDQKIESI